MSNPQQKLRLTQRRQRILAELRANPAVRISTLARQFQVTTETVRRDMDALAREGLIRRTYGGATAGVLSSEPQLDQRHALLPEARSAIAQRMVEFLDSGEVLMMDSGATTTHLARVLAGRDLKLKVITNSLLQARILGENPKITVILCPGYYDHGEAGVYGPEVAEFLSRYRANHAILGVGGLGEEGPSDFRADVVWVKRAMIQRAGQVSVLADHGKFLVRGMEIICDYGAITRVVADRSPPRELRDALGREKVGVVVVEDTAIAI